MKSNINSEVLTT